MEQKKFIGAREISLALFGSEVYHLDVGCLLRLAKIPKKGEAGNAVYVLYEKDILAIKKCLEDLNRKICS